MRRVTFRFPRTRYIKVDVIGDETDIRPAAAERYDPATGGKSPSLSRLDSTPMKYSCARDAAARIRHCRQTGNDRRATRMLVALSFLPRRRLLPPITLTPRYGIFPSRRKQYPPGSYVPNFLLSQNSDINLSSCNLLLKPKKFICYYYYPRQKTEKT